MKNNNDKHTVEYRPTNYYSMCEKSKEKIKRMQDMGMSTPYDARKTPEEADKESHMMMYIM